MKGARGVDLHDIWKDDSEAFLGIFAPEMPNYFTATGPNTPVGSGSIFGMIDATADYILKWCLKIASEGIRSAYIHAYYHSLPLTRTQECDREA